MKSFASHPRRFKLNFKLKKRFSEKFTLCCPSSFLNSGHRVAFHTLLKIFCGQIVQPMLFSFSCSDIERLHRIFFGLCKTIFVLNMKGGKRKEGNKNTKTVWYIKHWNDQFLRDSIVVIKVFQKLLSYHISLNHLPSSYNYQYTPQRFQCKRHAFYHVFPCFFFLVLIFFYHRVNSGELWDCPNWRDDINSIQPFSLHCERRDIFIFLAITVWRQPPKPRRRIFSYS